MNIETFEERLKESLDYYQDLNQERFDECRFYDGHKQAQWDDDVVKGRRNRPVMTQNMLPNIGNHIVNPFRQHPLGIGFEGEDNELIELIQGLSRQIEHESCASEAYETALLFAVKCGLGWFKIDMDYVDDESFDKKFEFSPILKPHNVFPDPYFKKIDGSDLRWVTFYDAIPEDYAVEKYGEDVKGNASMESPFNQLNLPDKSIGTAVQYYIEEKEVERVFLTREGQELNGKSYIDDPKEPILEQFVKGTRKVGSRTCKVCKVIGKKIVEETEINIPYIPVIPVCGELVYREDHRLDRKGLTYLLQDSQRMLNYYVSNEAELTALAPKMPFIGSKKAVGNYVEKWATANTKSHSILLFDDWDAENQRVINPPFRADNTAQTQSVIASQQNVKETMGRITGVLDTMMGGMAFAGETAKGQQDRVHRGEISTAHFADNLKKSVNHAGRVLLEMMISEYTEPTETVKRTEEGQIEPVTVNLSGLDASNFQVTVEAGPAYASLREETRETLNSISQLNPQTAQALAPEMVKTMNMPNKDEVLRILYAMLPPELRPQEQSKDAPDPEAMQALQTAQGTIAELNAANEQMAGDIERLMTYIASMEAENETEILKTAMQEQGENDRAELKAQTDIAKEIIKKDGQVEKEELKIEGDMLKQAQAQVKEITEEVQEELSEVNARPEGFLSVEQPSSMGADIEGESDTNQSGE